MRTQPGSEVIDQDRRQLLSTAMKEVAVAGTASLLEFSQVEIPVNSGAGP
jgi:hypothetical protein